MLARRTWVQVLECVVSMCRHPLSEARPGGQYGTTEGAAGNGGPPPLGAGARMPLGQTVYSQKVDLT